MKALDRLRQRLESEGEETFGTFGTLPDKESGSSRARARRHGEEEREATKVLERRETSSGHAANRAAGTGETFVFLSGGSDKSAKSTAAKPWAADPAEACDWSRTPLPDEWCELPDLPDDDEHAAWLRGKRYEPPDSPPPFDDDAHAAMLRDHAAVRRDLWDAQRKRLRNPNEAAKLLAGNEAVWRDPAAVPCKTCGDVVSWRAEEETDWRCRTCDGPNAERRASYGGSRRGLGHDPRRARAPRPAWVLPRRPVMREAPEGGGRAHDGGRMPRRPTTANYTRKGDDWNGGTSFPNRVWGS